MRMPGCMTGKREAALANLARAGECRSRSDFTFTEH
jgi:hypothetical protein